jgi:YggT family protein
LGVVSTVGQTVYLVLYLFWLSLFARFMMSFILSVGRRWHPGRLAAASLEVVWSVTDPPLKALRRVIPPLRVGTVSFDLSALVLLLILYVLMTFVVVQLFR